jgi:hypothetical protein
MLSSFPLSIPFSTRFFPASILHFPRPFSLSLAGLGTSPSASVKLDFGKIEEGDLSPGGRSLAGLDRRDIPTRRRRYGYRDALPYGMM